MTFKTDSEGCVAKSLPKKTFSFDSEKMLTCHRSRNSRVVEQAIEDAADMYKKAKADEAMKAEAAAEQELKKKE